jgi:hypothetical protein
MRADLSLPARLPPPWLVIGVGNPLRGDDGVAWALLAELEPARSGLRLQPLQQLTPDLAADLAAVAAVLFVDAWRPAAAGRWSPGRRISRRRIGPRLLPLAAARPAAAAAWSLSHGLQPAELLALSGLLYGVQPCAHQLLVPAHRLEHRLGLSSRQRRQLPAARRLLRRWLQAVGAGGAEGA